jgi:hypothetical protein
MIEHFHFTHKSDPCQHTLCLARFGEEEALVVSQGSQWTKKSSPVQLQVSSTKVIFTQSSKDIQSKLQSTTESTYVTNSIDRGIWNTMSP